MVLNWVKANIGKFGGDPDKVTIFGEDSGAASVTLMAMSPLAKGLFHRAIALSGETRNSILDAKNVEYFKDFQRKLFKTYFIIDCNSHAILTPHSHIN